MCYTHTFYFQHCNHHSHTVPLSKCEYDWSQEEERCLVNRNFVNQSTPILNPVFCTECVSFRVALLETEFEQKKKKLIEMGVSERWDRDATLRSLREWAREKEDAFTKFNRTLNSTGATAAQESAEQNRRVRESRQDYRLYGPDEEVDPPAPGFEGLSEQDRSDMEGEQAEWYGELTNPAIDSTRMLRRIDHLLGISEPAGIPFRVPRAHWDAAGAAGSIDEVFGRTGFSMGDGA